MKNITDKSIGARQIQMYMLFQIDFIDNLFKISDSNANSFVAFNQETNNHFFLMKFALQNNQLDTQKSLIIAFQWKT